MPWMPSAEFDFSARNLAWSGHPGSGVLILCEAGHTNRDNVVRLSSKEIW